MVSTYVLHVLFIHDICWEVICVLLFTTLHMQLLFLAPWCSVLSNYVFEFFWIECHRRGLTASKMDLVSSLFILKSFLCSSLPMSDCTLFFSYIKIGKGERGSSLGEIGLWRIMSPHSEAILSSERYNELELWVLLKLPLVILLSPPPLHLIIFPKDDWYFLLNILNGVSSR